MTAFYNVNRRCCATCRFWNGERRPDFRGYRLHGVVVSGTAAPCIAKPNSAKPTPVNYCPRWQKAPELST